MYIFPSLSHSKNLSEETGWGNFVFPDRMFASVQGLGKFHFSVESEHKETVNRNSQ